MLLNLKESVHSKLIRKCSSAKLSSNVGEIRSRTCCFAEAEASFLKTTTSTHITLNSNIHISGKPFGGAMEDLTEDLLVAAL